MPKNIIAPCGAMGSCEQERQPLNTHSIASGHAINTIYELVKEAKSQKMNNATIIKSIVGKIKIGLNISIE